MRFEICENLQIRSLKYDIPNFESLTLAIRRYMVLYRSFLNFMHSKCDIGVSRIPETRLLFVPPVCCDLFPLTLRLSSLCTDRTN